MPLGSVTLLIDNLTIFCNFLDFSLWCGRPRSSKRYLPLVQSRNFVSLLLPQPWLSSWIVLVTRGSWSFYYFTHHSSQLCLLHTLVLNPKLFLSVTYPLNSRMQISLPKRNQHTFFPNCGRCWYILCIHAFNILCVAYKFIVQCSPVSLLCGVCNNWNPGRYIGVGWYTSFSNKTKQ